MHHYQVSSEHPKTVEKMERIALRDLKDCVKVTVYIKEYQIVWSGRF